VPDPTREIEETFRRIRRPLQWPMEAFRRRKVHTASFIGYRFSRVRRRAEAGFAFGFLLRDGGLPIHAEPPEVVAYAFVRPGGSALHEALVRRAGSPVRRLVRAAAREDLSFAFDPEGEMPAIRHRSLRSVPPELFPLVASDFFMLTYRPMRASEFIERVRKATTRPG
jgi:hypothetical protein